MSGQREGSGFSLGWVLVAYFMICGGFVLTAVIFGVAKVSGSWTGYATFGIGAFVGGFFAGRASPHKSVAEPAIGGALMVLSIVAFFAATPLGQVLYDTARDAALREALILGGIALAGGLAGAVVGEKSSAGGPRSGGLRWLGLSTLITTGAMFAALTATAALLIHQAASDAAQPSLDSASGTTTAFVVALAIASFLGGMVTQMAAPARVLLASGGGAFVAIGAVGLLGIATAGGDAKGSGEAGVGIAIVAAAAFLIGLIGAAIGWMAVRSRKAATS